MSFKSQTYYGFKIGSNLSDIVDETVALEQLNLDLGDLSIIRGANEIGTKREDLIAISDLNDPLYKTLDRYYGETGTYQRILANSSGIDSNLIGNLQVNGSVGGSAIRFKYIDYTRKLFGSVTGTLIKNERLTDNSDPNTTGIIKEIGTGFVVISDITGGPFSPGRIFTGSYSGASFSLSSSDNLTARRFADISTSRVSAWSTTSTTPTDADPIFFGGQIKIANGPTGVGGKVTVNKINWGQTAIERLKQQTGFRQYNGPYITGELATHTITINVDGQDYKLYAMKSIPLKFRSQYQRLAASIGYRQATTTASRVSWRINVINNPRDLDNMTYTEVGTDTVSSLSVSARSNSLRDIEIYYNPDYISRITLPSARISSLPDAQLPELKELNLLDNIIKEMPNIKLLAPNLLTLYISKNAFVDSTTPNLRAFTKEVADRLPNTLTALAIGSTFKSSTIRCVSSNNVPINTISKNGTVGSITGAGTIGSPWTATITGMSSTVGLSVNGMIAANPESGELYGGNPTSVVVTTISNTSVSYQVIGGTTPRAGTVKNITDSHQIGGLNSYSVIEKACPNLKIFNIDTDLTAFGITTPGNGLNFAKDDYDDIGFLPSMPDSLTDYIVGGNVFARMPERGVKDLPNLVKFDVRGTKVEDGNFYLRSDVIQTVNIVSTALNIPNLSSKTALISFEARQNNFRNSLFQDNADENSYKFSNCVSLVTLSIPRTSVEGFIPRFKGNIKLKTVDFSFANSITGGRPNNGSHGYTDPVIYPNLGKTYVMYKDTFIDCPSIESFIVISSSLLEGKGFEPDTFKNMSALTTLEWQSSGRTGGIIAGGNVQLPDLSSCPRLTFLRMQNNNFTGPVPRMDSNNNIQIIQLQNNRLTGLIPTFENKGNLIELRLTNNELTGFNGFRGTSKLSEVYIENNRIAGEIPMLSGTSNSPNITRFYASNNLFNGYATGSFAKLTKIKNIDLSNNDLTESSINNIIDDLYSLWIESKKTIKTVTINLSKQRGAIGYVPSATGGSARSREVFAKIDDLRSKSGWTITIQ